jgi:hypothetical protein
MFLDFGKNIDDANFFERFYIDEHTEVRPVILAKTGKQQSGMNNKVAWYRITTNRSQQGIRCGAVK